MGNEPHTRAIHYINALDLLETLPAPTAQKFYSLVPPTLIQRIKALNSTDWIPASEFLLFNRSLYRALGPPGYSDFWKRNGLKGHDHPILNGTLVLLKKVGAITPRALLKALPAAFANNSRDSGTLFLREETRPKVAELFWSNVPPMLLSEPSYLEANRSGFALVFHVLKIRGTLEIKVNIPDQSGVWTFSWE
jgi:hypothetical protein